MWNLSHRLTAGLLLAGGLAAGVSANGWAAESAAGSATRQLEPGANELWVELTKLTASDGASFDDFGVAVALSGDTAFIGAPDAEAPATNQGAVYVFTNSDGVWTQQAKLTASDGANGDHFGLSVALLGDIALVGTPSADVGGNANQGAVYVFARSDGEWSQQLKLTADDGVADDQFGTSLALTGQDALIGAAGADGGQGAAYVFTHGDGPWSQQARLTAADGVAGDHFGSSAALDGDTALVGAVDGDALHGAAYVFVRQDGSWSQQARFADDTGEEDDELGFSVALDGNTALVGARFGAGILGGEVFVFVRDGDEWTQQAVLTASDPTINRFGGAVALADDTAVIGASSANATRGAVYVFARSGDQWSQQDRLVVDGAPTLESVGASVAFSGNTILAGAPNPITPGGAYVFLDLPLDTTILRGTVQSLYCGDELASLEVATVEIVGAENTYTLATDDDGFYQIFLPQNESPVDVTVTAPGHLPAEALDVELVGGAIETQDFGLRLDAPCATADPTSFAITLDPGQTVTESLTIGNGEGDAALEWAITTLGESEAGARPRGRPRRGAAAPAAGAPRGAPSTADSSRGGSSTRTADSVLLPLAGALPFHPAGGVVDCDNEPGVIIHDDGSVEQAYSANPDAVDEVAFVDRFTPTSYPASFRAVCVAFVTQGPTSLDFEIVVLDDDGPEGSPGTELGALPVSADGIPGGVGPVWFSYDISSLDLSIGSGSVYIGVRWETTSPPVFITADESSGNPPGFAGGFWWRNTVDAWEPIRIPFGNYRSLFVRAVQSAPSACGDPATIPWLAVDPQSGSTPAGGASEVEVAVDTTGLTPGEHGARICIETNDPVTPVLVVPVELTVTIPPDFAVLQGTVGGLGYCGADPGPVDGPEVIVESQVQTYMVEVDENGAYLLALDPAEGPVDITASASGHLPRTIPGIPLAEGETVVQDFGLVLEEPCVTVDPEEISVELDEGESTVSVLTLGNADGGAALDWGVVDETDAGGRLLRPAERATAVETAPVPTGVEGLMRGPGTAPAGTIVSQPFGEPPGELTITHSESPGIQADNTTACVNNQTGTTRANQYLRTFTLADFDIVDDFHVSEVAFGVQALTVTTEITINLYTLEGPFTYDNLTLIGTAVQSLPPQELSLVTVPVTGTAPAGSTLVVEIAAPDLIGVGRFFPGSNTLGETAPSYLATNACAIPQPTTYGDLGFPGVHLVMAVTGRAFECVLPTWTSVEPANGSVPAGGNQAVDVTFDTTGVEPGDHQGILCIGSNDPERGLAAVPLALTVIAVPAPELSFDAASLDFGDVEVETTSPPQVATLRNTGELDATGLSFDLSHPDFQADTGACGTTLPAGTSCDVSVTFTPAELGPADATLQVTGTEAISASLELTGNGLGDAIFTPMTLTVDPGVIVSDGNGVFEPGELVEVMPSWRNDGTLGVSLTGTAADFDGPDGADYSLADENADYGLIEPGATASCQGTGACYRLGVDDPVVRPATHWEATFDETLDDGDGTSQTWTLHIGASFTDVPPASPFYPAIETLVHSGITGGCAADLGRDGARPLQADGPAYCPGGANSRAQMPVFMLRALMGSDYTPPPCVEDDPPFGDVPFDSTFCPWIQDLADRGIVSGCGDGNYCPSDPVSRAQMAIFLLKTFEGGSYTPPECSGRFDDVPCPSTFADWIEELAVREITGGCTATEYCPGNPVSRAQMAVFVTKAFGLTLYGP